MADLRRDRGQIILIAAFALAITFVAIALVVNSAIFTENLATRSDQSDGSYVLQTRHEVEQNVGDVVEYANRNNLSALNESIINSVQNITTQSGLANAQRGRVVSVNVTEDSQNAGERIIQNSSANREYRSSSRNGDWKLASSVDGIRAVHFNVTDKGKLSTSEESAFHFVLDGTSRNWNMTIYKDAPSSDDMKVTVTNGSTSATCTREVTKSFFEIDVTRGQFAGSPCHALSYSNGDRMWIDGRLSNYEVRFTNGSQIAGNYSMVIDGDSLDSSFNSTSGPPPHNLDAIYGLKVNYTFETADVTYNTSVRVAPGEPHG